ncbi:siderophore ABC transporter substrate-binding protein [Virgibacillus sp. NKC19-3]|uniref:siderophore ABC transporter substrate-binding protein n=1 Tax=Virgibacillus saliphilus TaxID=2831674 RepID=UPI001C9A59DD|nr:siderophore ABC transporter substrate-binding protein [Virgibacillus sp. NKC19-3]MBY7142231.1 siderophore ABC transporter substrate-binding protein [Virgibacillus sp. NKC19-3]
MKRFSLLLIMSLFLMVLAACGSSEESSEGEGENAEGEETSEETNETVTVNHELGETEVPKNPENVVVFDFGILDTLDTLGVDVAGVAQGNIPSYLEKYESDTYENIGSLKEPDFDKVAEIDPDVIIISGRQASVADQLEEIAPTIHLGVDTTRYMDSFEENMETVGEIFGKEAEIEEELTRIEDSIASVNDKAAENEENGLIILANDDKISAYGPSSRFGLIHDVLGVPAVDEGIEASTHGMNVSPEYVMEEDPDLLYVVDRTAAITDDNSAAEQIVENDLIKNTKAYENDNIFYLDPDYWYLSGGGLASVSEMINEIDASLE